MGSCNGWETPAKGISGGHDAPLNRTRIVRGNDRIEIKHPHVMTRVFSGDIVISESAGGAGVGKPEERDPEYVKIDVKNDLVSLEKARDIYKVVLKPETLEIDYQATKTLRGERG
jgi:N-methylhydantoinase B